jgi:hypothetical protein
MQIKRTAQTHTKKQYNEKYIKPSKEALQMKTVKVTFLLTVNDGHTLDYWLPEEINERLTGDEEILDYTIETVPDDVERIITHEEY